jgi:hypothetical protein
MHKCAATASTEVSRPATPSLLHSNQNQIICPTFSFSSPNWRNYFTITVTFCISKWNSWFNLHIPSYTYCILLLAPIIRDQLAYSILTSVTHVTYPMINSSAHFINNPTSEKHNRRWSLALLVVTTARPQPIVQKNIKLTFSTCTKSTLLSNHRRILYIFFIFSPPRLRNQLQHHICFLEQMICMSDICTNHSRSIRIFNTNPYFRYTCNLSYDQFIHSYY